MRIILFVIALVSAMSAVGQNRAAFVSRSTLNVDRAGGRIYVDERQSHITVYPDEVHIETQDGYAVYRACRVKDFGNATVYTCDGCEVTVQWNSCEGCTVEVVMKDYQRIVYQDIARL